MPYPCPAYPPLPCPARQTNRQTNGQTNTTTVALIYKISFPFPYFSIIKFVFFFLMGSLASLLAGSI